MIIFILTSDHCPHCVSLRNSNGVVLTEGMKQTTSVHRSFGEYRYSTFVEILRIGQNVMIEAHLIRGQVAEINTFGIRGSNVIQTTYRPNPEGKTTMQIRTIGERSTIAEKVNLYSEVPDWENYVTRTLPMKQIIEHIRGVPAFAFINETLWSESIAKISIPLYMRGLGYTTSDEGTFTLTPSGGGPNTVKEAVEYFTNNPDQLLPTPLRNKEAESAPKVEEEKPVKVVEGLINNKPVEVYRNDIVFIPKRRRR